MAVKTGTSFYGVDIADGAVNTKGSWVEVVPSSSVTEDVCLLKINVSDASTSVTSWLIDIGTGGSGSESVLIANIPFSSATQFNVGQWSILVPVSLPTGTRISARCQSNNAGAVSVRVQVHCIGGQLNTATNATYGSSTATSAATTVDPGAVASTKGSWVQLTASSTQATEWLVVVLTVLGNAARDAAARYNLDIGTGGAGSETVVVPDLTFSTDTASDDFQSMQFMVPVSIAAGTRIAVRGASTSTDATDRLFGVSIITASVVASNFGTFVTEQQPEWNPQIHYMRPAPARHHQTGGTFWQPNTPPNIVIPAEMHQTELPMRRHPHHQRPEGTFFDNPTPHAPGNITQAGAHILQALGQSQLSQAGVHILQSPLGISVTQIGLHVIYIPGPGIPPTQPPEVPLEACPADDFPIGSGSDRAGCSE